MNSTLDKAIQLINHANANDPNNGVEKLYSKHMLETLRAFDNSASEPLTLACYAQHVCRWKLVREDYPEGLDGYLRWRTELAKLHAKILGEAMQEVGYDADAVKRAQHIIQKRKLKTDPDSQTLEDVSCLVFLQHYLGPFVKKHSEDKVVDIIKKTWVKMSDKGQQVALQAELPEHLSVLVKKALA
ncbi:MAG: hypothetical protein A6F72_00660 [Cycloclasticus sp. symbiont of Poecilosclerida sp. N]|nr:MAG: hypothetical protein A6F72_00660 [Cycloclasticus sp. symbiont of Poecilosclerida sp. N]